MDLMMKETFLRKTCKLEKETKQLQIQETSQAKIWNYLKTNPIKLSLTSLNNKTLMTHLSQQLFLFKTRNQNKSNQSKKRLSKFLKKSRMSKVLQVLEERRSNKIWIQSNLALGKNHLSFKSKRLKESKMLKMTKVIEDKAKTL
jgi:hypothetical protein